MVLPAKVFELKEPIGLEQIKLQVGNFREEDSFEGESGNPVNLITEVYDVRLADNTLSGVFSRDFVNRSYYRRSVVETPVTEEAPFWIKPFGGRLFMVVMAPSVARGVKKLLTGNVANKLGDVIYGKPWAVTEARLSNETLKRLHEFNPGSAKLIWFDDVDIPSVEKLCLAGSSLADTKLYRDYTDHGKIWYVVFEVQKRGLVVGITRNCVVTLFSKSTMDDFIRYVLEDLLILVD